MTKNYFLTPQQMGKKKTKMREYYKKNREKILAKLRTPEAREKGRLKKMEYYRKDPERYKAAMKKWRDTRGIFVRRYKSYGDKRCLFCGILLASRFADGKGRTKIYKYCYSCQKNPKVRTQRCTLLTRRWRQKKMGLPQEPIAFPQE